MGEVWDTELQRVCKDRRRWPAASSELWGFYTSTLATRFHRISKWLALIFLKSPTGLMSSPTIRTPDQRQMSGDSALANQHWSGMWPINVFPMSPRYLACLKSGMVTPEKRNSQWEGKTGSEGKPGRGVASVAVAFSQWNTVVVPPWHYKKSIPLDTGNLCICARWVWKSHTQPDWKKPWWRHDWPEVL